MEDNSTRSTGQGGERVAEAMARALLNLISNETTGQGVSPNANSRSHGITENSVDNEMQRAFPSLYRSRTNFNYGEKRRRFSSPPAKQIRSTDVEVYLLDHQSETTPSDFEQSQLMLAGLGKGSINIKPETSHNEIQCLLEQQFPKLTSIIGGWLIYKAQGGSGKRKINLIPPEATGYSGKIVLSASNNGKSMLFVAPIQGQLDTSPLPKDSPRFAGMPKETCQQCHQLFPLNVLVAHIKECAGEPNKKTEDRCPMCFEQWPVDEIEDHASICEGNYREAGTVAGPPCYTNPGKQMFDDKISSVEDVMNCISSRVKTDKKFQINVTRENILQRGLKQWLRQKKSTPEYELSVSFITEAGIDTGALRKEFLTEMVVCIESQLFEAAGEGKGKNPLYSPYDLENGHFRAVGQIFAVSLSQGGPAPCFLREWCYRYIACGDLSGIPISVDDISDAGNRELVQRIAQATQTDLEDMTCDIHTCGYTSVINVANKERILRCMILHYCMRLLPILDHIRKGLDLYGLSSIIASHVDVCRQLFCPSEDPSVPDSDFLMSVLAPQMSDIGTSRRKIETDIMNRMQDFLQELESEEMCYEEDGTFWLNEGTTDENQKSNNNTLTIPLLMQWLTGQQHKPLLPHEKNDFVIHVEFDHKCIDNLPEHTVCYPTVSACTRTLRLPTAHLKTYEDFKHVMTQAVLGDTGFHKV